MTKTIEAFGIEITLSLGRDGKPVIEIDTPNLPEDSAGPLMRVWLNDEIIHGEHLLPENNPETLR